MGNSIGARPTSVEPSKGHIFVFLSIGSPEGIISEVTTTIQEPRLQLSLKGPASLMVLVFFVSFLSFEDFFCVAVSPFPRDCPWVSEDVFFLTTLIVYLIYGHLK